MNLLLIHQNFPCQFKNLAPALVRAGHKVVAMPLIKEAPASWEGVEISAYTPARFSNKGTHPWLQDFEAKTIRAEACFRTAMQLRSEGFRPDVDLTPIFWTPLN